MGCLPGEGSHFFLSSFWESLFLLLFPFSLSPLTPTSLLHQLWSVKINKCFVLREDPGLRAAPFPVCCSCRFRKEVCGSLAFKYEKSNLCLFQRNPPASLSLSTALAFQRQGSQSRTDWTTPPSQDRACLDHPGPGTLW